MVITCAPKVRKITGAIRLFAPLEQSMTTFKPFSLVGALAMMWSMYSLSISPSLITRPTEEPRGFLLLSCSAATIASISSSTASGSLCPVCEKNLMPLSSNGLCEAEITAPALACSLLVKYETAGVGITPKRCASPPAEQMPAARAASSIVPLKRVSRPMMILGLRVSLPK